MLTTNFNGYLTPIHFNYYKNGHTNICVFLKQLYPFFQFNFNSIVYLMIVRTYSLMYIIYKNHIEEEREDTGILPQQQPDIPDNFRDNTLILPQGTREEILQPRRTKRIRKTKQQYIEICWSSIRTTNECHWSQQLSFFLSVPHSYNSFLS